MRLKISLALAVGLALGVIVAGSVGLTARADPPPQGYTPDPAPIAAKRQWIFRVDVKAGKIALGAVKPKDLDKAQASPRVMGRYALELWVGKELLDRVRFNVPGAGDGPHEDKSVLKRPQMDRINTRFGVRMADNPRATQCRLVDRATGDETWFVWPPNEDGVMAPVRGDGGSSGGAGDGGTGTDAGATRGADAATSSLDAGAKDATPWDAGARDAEPADAAPRGGSAPSADRGPGATRRR